MRPEQYIERLEELIAAGQDEAALDFSIRARADLRPELNADQFDHVAALMEGAIMTVKMSDAAEAHRARGA